MTAQNLRTWVYVTLQLLMPTLALVFAIAFWFNIYQLQFLSRIYPQIVIGVLAIFTGMDFAVRFAKWRHGGLADEVAEAYPEEESLEKVRRPTAMMAVTAAFVWGMGAFGYYAILGPFVVVSLFVLGVRRLSVLIVTPAAFLVVSYASFTYLVGLPLP